VNLFGYGIVTYLIGFYIASFKFENNFSILAQGIIPSLSLGFAIAAVFLTTTIPDTKGDRSSGKKTFSVVYGEKKTAYCAALCCGFSLLFSFAIPNNNWIMIVQSAVSLLIFITFAHSNKHNQAFKTFRWPVFMLSLLVVLYVPLFLFALLIPLVTCRFYYKIRFNYTYPTLSHS
jgi:1,4-dihydroxy-2-naphthoate octaprenyltransferase